ncbi:Flp family type IVb pilin [Salinicoccus cyprini]|uniref:Flp family type IVb pilin n=1 Tax=Salinicoccus cyprini TaxID=2493691 RepID=A0A558ASW4_9STAP|nr:Flp family type IVb pilin [Salinicoccus cyprini]TVT27363.1 Flp family type IVb pilin [Salinicoccus cyprini]
MMEFFKGLLMEEEGQGMTEYGLILGVLVVIVVAAFGLFADEISAMLGRVVTAIKTETTPAP